MASTKKQTTPARKTKTKSQASARGEDWKAAKEILTAHRTLARAERRETELADQLRADAKTLKLLRAGAKRPEKSLSAAKGDLDSSVKARRKAADRLSDLERAAARTSRTRPAKKAAATKKTAASKKASTAKKTSGSRRSAKK